MFLQRALAVSSLVAAAVLAVVTYTWRTVEIPLLSRDYGAAIMFLFGVAVFVPFVVTFCRLGLALDEHEESDPGIVGDVARRQQMVSMHCPYWSKTWQLSIVFTAVSFIGYAAFPKHVNPVYALISAVCFVSGIWFAFVYPVACFVLDDTNGEITK